VGFEIQSTCKMCQAEAHIKVRVGVGSKDNPQTQSPQVVLF